MSKSEYKKFVCKEMIRALARGAESDGSPDMTRVDFCNAHFGWHNRYDFTHKRGTPGFHVSRLMEEVANEEGWVFAYDVRANGSRDNIRIEFPQNANNRELKAA